MQLRQHRNKYQAQVVNRTANEPITILQHGCQGHVVIELLSSRHLSLLTNFTVTYKSSTLLIICYMFRSQKNLRYFAT